jgi:phosphoenolpyruvate carboxylase
MSRTFGKIDTGDFDEIVVQTIGSITAMQAIQDNNGEPGSNRYIISNNESAANVLEVLALFEMAGWQNPTVDVVPLFEIIDDLQDAANVMTQLYTNKKYAAHLEARGDKQTVMLGFSDGTKDGGYLMANWSIYKAKESITAVSREFGIDVVFFDGRGGPPARGGGKTHQFYASLGPDIENREIQLTIQGQTISSNFGTPDSCRFNLENLISAGVYNHLSGKNKEMLNDADKSILDALAEIGYEKYIDFKNHPQFVPYLEQRSALKYYARTNIGSRPSKRNAGEKLNLPDLRAIPFVGSWSQLKQNVPGFFGVGTALRHFEQAGKWQRLQELYNRSLFFRTLLENSMMSLAKSFLPLTAYMKDDPEFGSFWQIISDEFDETKRLLLKIAGHTELMENYPDGKASVATREQIVLPLLTIQQYALMRIDEFIKTNQTEEPAFATHEKLVIRSLFGNINASRNSA